MFEALYEGKKVEVVDQYEGIWVYRFPNDPTGRQGSIQKFTDLNGRPLLVNGVYTPPTPGQPNADLSSSSLSSPPPAPIALVEKSQASVLINYLSKTELQKTLKGISKLHAAKVYERRPYKSWDHLAETNGDLPVDWSAVQEDIEVELDFTQADKP